MSRASLNEILPPLENRQERKLSAEDAEDAQGAQRMKVARASRAKEIKLSSPRKRGATFMRTKNCARCPSFFLHAPRIWVPACAGMTAIFFMKIFFRVSASPRAAYFFFVPGRADKK
jgi:hypothetical protein